MAATLSISDRNPATGPTWWRERVKAVTENLAVRHGIKFGLAGTVSVFVALLVRLPEPARALITVFVVMLAQFVGAVAEKSVMRVIGTIAGGVIGYLLTAGLEQQPVLYLLLVGSVVGFGTAMFGYTKYPYAFPALRANNYGRRQQRNEQPRLFVAASALANRGSLRGGNCRGPRHECPLAAIRTERIYGKDAAGARGVAQRLSVAFSSSFWST